MNLGVPELINLMQSRHNNYTFLGYILYNKLNVEDFLNLKIKDYIEGLTKIETDDEVPGLSYLKEFLNVKKNYQESINSSREDFQKLFEGPNKLLAPPWESVYLSDEHLMFDEQTIEVRDFYGRYGMQISNQGVEPDDHIGLELQFIAFLTEKTLEALEKEDIDSFTEVISVQEEFLKKHIILWVSEFSESMYKGAETSLYKGLAHFLLWYLENDAEIISSLK